MCSLSLFRVWQESMLSIKTKTPPWLDKAGSPCSGFSPDTPTDKVTVRKIRGVAWGGKNGHYKQSILKFKKII
jgi:hypothetical protein